MSKMILIRCAEIVTVVSILEWTLLYYINIFIIWNFKKSIIIINFIFNIRILRPLCFLASAVRALLILYLIKDFSVVTCLLFYINWKVFKLNLYQETK